MIRAVVFDLGGVVLDWNPRHLYRKLLPDPEAVERFLAEIGFDAWNVEQDRGRPFSEGVALLGERFPERRDLIAAYHHRWEESILGPIQGTVDILGELRHAGVPLHALSNWSAETFALVRGRYPFLGWFDPLVLSGEERVCKPDPGIFHILLRRAGRQAAECLFVDDSAANVEAARALGFAATRFQSPELLRQELLAHRLLPTR